jgi:hypothetical protein
MENFLVEINKGGDNYSHKGDSYCCVCEREIKGTEDCLVVIAPLSYIGKRNFYVCSEQCANIVILQEVK